MRDFHFTQLAPVCPRCRAASGTGHRLEALTQSVRQDGRLMDGILACTNAGCRQEFPVIGGLPALVPDVRAFLGDAMFHFLSRDDISAEVESLLGDAAGAGSGFDAVRQQQSSYGWDHWSDLDPDDQEGGGGAVLAGLEAGLNLLPEAPAGPVLDLGCATGRTSFHLADRLGLPVVGVDLNVPLIRIGQRVLLDGVVRYPLRRGGVVYDRREFPVTLPAAAQVDFWVGDALSLPFADASFGLVSALNLIECLSSPKDGLAEIARVLKPGGAAVIACPFDWSAAVTPMESWIGGHSQRGSLKGSPEAVLDKLLAEGGLGLSPLAPGRDVAWRVRLHDRATVDYQTHVVALRKTEVAG